MNIRPKVTLVIASVCLVLGAAEFLVAKAVLLPSFTELERADARTAMRRMQYTLDSTLKRLAMSAMDWGDWAETYRFVQDRDTAHYEDLVGDGGIKELQINLVLIVDLSGQFVLARALDYATGAPLDLDLIQARFLPADFPWWQAMRAGRPAQGLLRTNLGILMLAESPIMDGSGQGATRGMIIMGRLLTPAEARNLGAQAQTRAWMHEGSSGTVEQLVETDDVTHVYRSFDDIYGHPVMTLRVDVPRQITRRGHTAVAYASVYLFGAGVVLVVLVLFVLHRVVLSPLALLTRHAVAIGQGKDLTQQLNLQGQDEIGVLARELDQMMLRLADSRRRLVDRSFDAGSAELARGILHNLGNAMTPIGVRLAGLREKLQAAPVEDAERAAAELESATADPDRRADLEEFVRLSCQEMASSIRSAQSDVLVLDRQTTVVQSALAEQMRSARNEHVIEPVKLTELITQSLEIVPDACRQRLDIELDESLKRIGVVHIARTVLRLVLQNLIINAAEAVNPETNRKGTLRIGAVITHCADHGELHLYCTDDGVGITPGDRERIFEKGFSTKSTHGNRGIGLHWCANAIHGLGGRIWAVSDGPGMGASLHVLIPLDYEAAALAGAA